MSTVIQSPTDVESTVSIGERVVHATTQDMKVAVMFIAGMVRRVLWTLKLGKCHVKRGAPTFHLLLDAQLVDLF